jgi:bacillithiol biosynthesis cysteine-adding enzyme BshC
LKLEKAEIYYSQPLTNKYLLQYQQVAHLYDYNPYLERSYQQRLTDVMDYSGFKRQELCQALTLYNQSIGAGEKALQNINRLASNAVVVMTGQQPGILAGPLYTIYKALAACLLANKLSRTLNHPVIPIFWVGSEDHDFQEINHINVPSSDGPVMLKLPYGVNGRLSVGAVPLLPQVQHLLQQMKDLCHGDHQEILWHQIQTITESSSNLSNWFAKIISWLFQDYGLVIVDAMLPEIRKQQAHFFRRVLRDNEIIDNAFHTAYNSVVAMGIKPQVEYTPNRANLFVYHQQQRVALYRNNGGFCSRDGKLNYSKQELLSLAENSPELFSLNVILKPVATELIFPLLTYVGGPGEISYYALCKYIYRFFERKMPIIYPRPSVTLIEPRASKYLNKYNILPKQFISNSANCIECYLQKTQSININESFVNFNDGLIALHNKLFSELSVLQPDIRELEKENLRSILKKVHQLRGKTEQRHRKDHQDELRQLKWLQHQLTPPGGQERTYNVVPYLVKYGAKLINDLGELPLLDGIKHNIVYL